MTYPHQCECLDCDCDLIAPDDAICIACRNGCCGTVPRCGRPTSPMEESPLPIDDESKRRAVRQ